MILRALHIPPLPSPPLPPPLSLLQIGIFRKVAMRFAAISHRTAQSFFGAWRLLVVELRAHLHLALEHRRKRVLGLALSAWIKAAEELHKVRGGGGCTRQERAVLPVYYCVRSWPSLVPLFSLPSPYPAYSCACPLSACLLPEPLSFTSHTVIPVIS